MADLNNVLEHVREDDFIEYYLFPQINTNEVKEQETVLTIVFNKCNEIIKKCSKDYLWHKDEFALSPRTNPALNIDGKNGNFPPHLFGVTHYGDCIEDEWFIVHILQELTQQVPGLVGRICDSDGEFLLIESADYLPSWANPSICENRVFLYRGNVHIIKPRDNLSPGDISMLLSEIHVNPDSSIASKEIQNCILNKTRGYPEKIKDNLHCAIVYLPVGVATILKHKPSLISAVVHAFCNRDSIDLKVCRAMKYFPPEQRILCSVTFTKLLYAMLVHSKYQPDSRTGWNLPSATSPQYKSHNLGVKIACGFEILISQAKPSQDIENEKEWQSYLKSLKSKNYFNDLLEHSREFNNLLNKAKEYYISHRDSMHCSSLIGQEILEYTRNLNFKLDIDENNLKEDDDSWLNISPEELDKLLQEKYGQKKLFSVNNNTNPASFTDKVNTFFNQISDMEGAEFPNMSDSPSRPPRGKKTKGKNMVSFSEETKITEKEPSKKIDFDPNSFSCALQNILSFVIPEDDSWDLESGSDMSDYGEDNFVNTEETYDKVKNKMTRYMAEMDKELASSTIGESFEKKHGDGFDDIENFKPVDIDMNALKNILESYRGELGEAGPSSNMLGPMGMHLDEPNSCSSSSNKFQ